MNTAVPETPATGSAGSSADAPGSTSVDPELLAFAARLLDRRGGLVERFPEHLTVLLPDELARFLEIPDETELGNETTPLLYGSPLLDRLVALATRDVPVAYGGIAVPYLKKAGFEGLLGQDISFADGQVRVSGRAETRATYMVLIAHYLALSDERKEGLVQVAVHEGNGAVIEDFEHLWREFGPEFYAPEAIPPHFPVDPRAAMERAMEKARGAVEGELAEFLASMKRRLQRDVTNTREYYEALENEMRASLSHPNLTEGQRQERLAKIDDLPAEMARKVEDLEGKYQVQVTVKACAALRLLVNVAQVSLQWRYRKQQREVHLTWNPVTRRLDPLVCESCHVTVRRVFPPSRSPNLRVLCFECSQGKG